mgnify:CR=1 FL=1
MSKKTSFKDLLAKGGSNPLVNLKELKSQRQRMEELKHKTPGGGGSGGEPSAKHQAVAATSAATPIPSRPEARTAPLGPAFVRAPIFAGAKNGYAFKAGPHGVGYYAECGAPERVHAPQPARVETSHRMGGSSVEAGKRGVLAADDAMGEAAAAAGSKADDDHSKGSHLPGGFFDNPQDDPANRGKEVAATVKEQQLREEMEEFNKQVRRVLVTDVCVLPSSPLVVSAAHGPCRDILSVSCR